MNRRKNEWRQDRQSQDEEEEDVQLDTHSFGPNDSVQDSPENPSSDTPSSERQAELDRCDMCGEPIPGGARCTNCEEIL